MLFLAIRLLRPVALKWSSCLSKVTPTENINGKEIFSLNSLSQRLSFNLRRSSELQNLADFNEKSAKWHTLNTLMIISNNKKIESLQNVLDAERARLRFVEDKSEQMEKQVSALKFTLMEAGGRLRNYHRNLLTVITLLKVTTIKPAKSESSISQKIRALLLSINSANFGQVLSLNALPMLVSLLVSRVFMIDAIIDALGKMLLLLKMPKRSIERTKLGMKLSAIIFIFIMLRKRLQTLAAQFKAWVNFMF